MRGCSSERGVGPVVGGEGIAPEQLFYCKRKGNSRRQTII